VSGAPFNATCVFNTRTNQSVWVRPLRFMKPTTYVMSSVNDKSKQIHVATDSSSKLFLSILSTHRTTMTIWPQAWTSQIPRCAEACPALSTRVGAGFVVSACTAATPSIGTQCTVACSTSGARSLFTCQSMRGRPNTMCSRALLVRGMRTCGFMLHECECECECVQASQTGGPRGLGISRTAGRLGRRTDARPSASGRRTRGATGPRPRARTARCGADRGLLAHVESKKHSGPGIAVSKEASSIPDRSQVRCAGGYETVSGGPINLTCTLNTVTNTLNWTFPAPLPTCVQRSCAPLAGQVWFCGSPLWTTQSNIE
jgi:hypothetical protein